MSSQVSAIFRRVPSLAVRAQDEGHLVSQFPAAGASWAEASGARARREERTMSFFIAVI